MVEIKVSINVKNKEYIQTSLTLKFPNISEMCVIYRIFKQQNELKIARG